MANFGFSFKKHMFCLFTVQNSVMKSNSHCISGTNTFVEAGRDVARIRWRWRWPRRGHYVPSSEGSGLVPQGGGQTVGERAGQSGPKNLELFSPIYVFGWHMFLCRWRQRRSIIPSSCRRVVCPSTKLFDHSAATSGRQSRSIIPSLCK